MLSYRGLRSPLWWASLAILALNDHALKGSGVLPGWLTGKLSDLAGLVVAPVLLATFAGARGPASRLACFALVVLPFVAIKVSTEAARAVEAVFGSLGIPWRLWVDWTDLAALVVLPIAWKLARQPARERAESARRRSGMLERAGVLIGGIACLATSESHELIEASLFLANLSPERIRIAVHRPSGDLDCDALRETPEAQLLPERFDTFACKTLEPMEPVPLDREWRDLTDPDEAPPPSAPRACEAVLLSSAALGDVIVFWQNVAKVAIDVQEASFDVEELDPHTLYLEPFGDRLAIAEIPLARVWRVDGFRSGANCE